MDQKPTAHQKIQKEYNELCAQWGHVQAQMFGLQDHADDLKERMLKLMKKAQNLPKEETKEIHDNQDEKNSGTDGSTAAAI